MVQLVRYDKHTPLAERERLIAQYGQGPFYGVKLQTCNRLELYSGQGSVLSGDVEHLFRVVAGLESGLVGDSSIQGQVKRAYAESTGRHNLSPSLHKLFQTALFVGKRVRTETGISRGAVSHSQTVYRLLHELMPSFRGARITLIGVHHINENIVRYLVKNGASSIFVANRTFDHAKVLADKYGATAFDFSSIEAHLQQTDVLISATAAPHLVVKAERFPKDKPMIVFDLAVPRDVDPAISQFPGVRLFNVSDLESHIDQNIEHRKDAIAKAEQIVKEEVGRFCIMMERYMMRWVS
ncbi:MAG: glutamyl-tRNA reductase [Breznakibacter sp.]